MHPDSRPAVAPRAGSRIPGSGFRPRARGRSDCRDFPSHNRVGSDFRSLTERDYHLRVSSDAQLFAAWCEGDNKAGNDLLKGQFQRLLCFFNNKAGDHTEDLIQQTMMACIQAKAQLRDHSSFRAFLLRIARNKLFDFLRAQSRNPVDFGVSSIHDLQPSPSSLVAKDREHVTVLDALRSLPVNLQMVLELHYWDELAVREVAEVLELPEGTIKGQLKRGRDALGRELRRRTGPHAELVAAMQRSRPREG